MMRGRAGRGGWRIAAMLALLGAAPAMAQIRTIDPNGAPPPTGPAPYASDAAPPYQSSPDLAPPGGSERAPEPGYGGAPPAPGYDAPPPAPGYDAPPPAPGYDAPPPAPGYDAPPPAPGYDGPPPAPGYGAGADLPPPPPPGATRPRSPTGRKLAEAAADDPTRTYQRDDLLAAAEGTFGKGAEGLAKMIERILKDQGRPNAYIGGREIGGAFIAGLRYGSGTLHSKLEGERPVYWTGPSVGFDFGGNGAKSFVLVYNLYDSQELYHRFPQAEGGLYFIGGFTASYLRWKDVVLIPIRLGVGLRWGVNVGYMKFSERAKVVPF